MEVNCNHRRSQSAITTAVANNCIGSGRPFGLEDKPPSARSRQSNGLQLHGQWVALVEYTIKTYYLGWN